MLNSSNYANGIILESAGNILMDIALDPVKYPEVLNYSFSALKSGLETLALNGITSFVDARTFYRRQHHVAYQRADLNNSLTSKVVLSLWAYVNDVTDEKQIEDLKKLFYDPVEGNLRMTQVSLADTLQAGVDILTAYLGSEINLSKDFNPL